MFYRFLLAGLACIALACIQVPPTSGYLSMRAPAPTITDVHREGCSKLCSEPDVNHGPSEAQYLYSDSSWPTIYCVCKDGRSFHMGAEFEWLEPEPVEE